MTTLLPLLLLAAPPPEVALPLFTTAPVVDGVIDEAEWSGAVRNVGLVSGQTGQLEPREAVFWIGSDGRALYIAVRSEVAPDGTLLTRAVPEGDFDSLAALHDDSIELVIHPHLGATTGDRRYFHVIVNERGAQFDRAFDEGNRASPVDVTWRLKDWTFKNRIAGGWWEVELAIPFASIGATAADLQHPWGLRVGRNWQRGWAQSRWETARAAYEDVPTMPRVSFVESAPVVQVMSLRGEGAARIELGLRNPGPAALPLALFVSDTWSRNPPRELSQKLELAPGERRMVVHEAPDGGPTGSHQTILRVTSPEGGRVYYQREFEWALARPANRWTLSEEDRQAVGLQYAVYPYHRRLRARVDVRSLGSRDEVTGASLSFVRQGAEAPLAACDLAFTDYQAEAELPLPDLPADAYEVRVQLRGSAAVPTEPVVGKYQRRLFDWEHNRLGTSDILVPPFTAIELREGTLSTILRRHELGPEGLWRQVTSLERPLLKAPMRWVVRVDGQPRAVTPSGFSVVSHKPTGAITRGGFAAGAVRAEVVSEWDYDGLARITVELPAAAGVRLDSLALEIPLDDSQMPYLHACGDGLRYNFAGRTPAGEGPIWDSSKANRTAIRTGFYPYLWVGGGERGLAWFADNDRGMIFDPATPALALERRDGVLTLRVSLIGRPVSLDRARKMEFGLQATPVKPMPRQPFDWRRWIGRSYQDQKAQPFTIIGSTLYYGQLSYDLWPIDGDLSIYQAFSKARDTGQEDPAFVADWLRKLQRHVKPGTERYEYLDRHIKAGMRAAAGTPRADGWLWTPYTNPRGMGFQQPEWPTFQDEWISFPYFERSTSGDVGYEVTPTESFRDAAMASYRAMMTCFDGIYWDNIYLSANHDTVAGGAWLDEDGTVHPSVGLWNMRELIRRTAIMFVEQGRPLFANVAHMTNTNLVPVLAFANVNLDWEWQYGNRDFQDRFSPELTVAESIGRQCGNVPLILSGGLTATDPAEKAWIQRTRLGVCLVHEIRVWDWQPAFHYDLYGKLFEFGYGTDACRVYNYWDDGFPLTIGGVDGRGIVLHHGPRAIAAVTDYGEGGTCALTLDLARRGLPPTARVIDVETGESVGQGATVSFPLRKHDFRVLRWE